MLKMQTLRCLSLNSKLYCSQKRDVTLQHFIGLRSHRVDWWEFWHTWKNSHSHSHRHSYSSHFHPYFWHICVPIPMEFQSWNSHGNPIPMHISTSDVTVQVTYLGYLRHQWMPSSTGLWRRRTCRHVTSGHYVCMLPRRASFVSTCPCGRRLHAVTVALW